MVKVENSNNNIQVENNKNKFANQSASSSTMNNISSVGVASFFGGKLSGTIARVAGGAKLLKGVPLVGTLASGITAYNAVSQAGSTKDLGKKAEVMGTAAGSFVADGAILGMSAGAVSLLGVAAGWPAILATAGAYGAVQGVSYFTTGETVSWNIGKKIAGLAKDFVSSGQRDLTLQEEAQLVYKDLVPQKKNSALNKNVDFRTEGYERKFKNLESLSLSSSIKSASDKPAYIPYNKDKAIKSENFLG